jgi:hypothetical protein
MTTDSRETRTYPRGWIRVEVFHDHAVLTYHYKCIAHGNPDLLRTAVAAVLDIAAECSGRGTAYFGVGTHAVFDCLGNPLNEMARHVPPGVREDARIAAQYGGPELADAVMVVFPLTRTDANGDVVPNTARTCDEFKDHLAVTVEVPRPAELIDGLMPAQCYAAFVARQRDQRTVELEIPVRLLRAGDVINEPGASGFVFERLGNLRPDGWISVHFTDGSALEVRVDTSIAVTRSADLTPAQLARARQTWSTLLRHDVGVSAQRAAAAAPSVAIANEELEIEALAGDA